MPDNLRWGAILAIEDIIGQSIARGQERQAIFDALPKERDSGQNESWNAGFDAAMTAVIRVLVERSILE